MLKHLDLAFNVLRQKHDTAVFTIYKVHSNNYMEDSLKGDKNGSRETDLKAITEIQVRR